jgi:putative FmdB family regulatory protein
MPLYEYECEACGQRFEKIRKFSDAPLETCDKCGNGPVKKLLSSPAIQFKGSGWYITDYAKSSGKDTKDSKDSKESKDTKESKESKDSKDTSKTDSSKPESASKAETK